ncbi:MAG: hypothetical protein ACXVAY_15495 [Mucilaginibacter sp.]
MPTNDQNSATTQDVTVDDSLNQSGAQPTDNQTSSTTTDSASNSSPINPPDDQSTNSSDVSSSQSDNQSIDNSNGDSSSSQPDSQTTSSNTINDNSSNQSVDQSRSDVSSSDSSNQSVDQSSDNGNSSSSQSDNQSTDSSSDSSGQSSDKQSIDNSLNSSNDNSSGNQDNVVAQNSGNSSQTNGDTSQPGNQQAGASNDIATWLGDDYPVRMLTVSQALQIVNYLITQSSPALQIDGGKVDQTNMTTMFTGNGVTQKIVKAYRIKPDVINGIQFKYLTSDTATKVIGFIDNVDPRMIVFLFKLTRWLKDTWGPANSVTVTEVHHIGIGHGNPDHLFDCHNTGRAMDLGGIAGTKGDSSAFTLSILNDWGKKPPVAAAGAQCFRLAATNGLIYNFARDFDAYAMQQCQDKSQGRDPKTSDTELQQRMFATGQPTVRSFILHPDYPDPTLRSAHQNHFHVQISTTGYESSPAL